MNLDAVRTDNQAAFSTLANGVTLMHASFSSHAFERHSHDCFSIAATTYGIQRFRCKGRQYDSRPGDFVLFNPDDDHDGKPGSVDGFRYTIWHLPTHIVAQCAGEDDGTVRGQYFSRPHGTDPQSTGTFLALSAALAHTSRETLRAESLMHAFLKTMLRRHGERQQAAVDPSGIAGAVALERVRAYIQAHYANDLTVADLASAAGLSRAHLTRAFSAAYHLPPHVYLNTVRVMQAQQRIRRGMPLALVALECGFADQSHLTRRFKGMVGATPSAWGRMTASARTNAPAAPFAGPG